MPAVGADAVVVLTREARAYRDAFRSYAVLIDGQQAGKIRRGQTKEFR